MRILFMGTPEFAVASLDALLQDGQDIVAVVTAPDKPAGRGRKIKSSAVSNYAREKGLPILKPDKLKSKVFLGELRELDPELVVVVAFRMLPEEVWAYPAKGTINLHASMLPHYRGAAPINRAIMNGETQTGLSTFFIEKDIDTGKIILQEAVEIGPEDTAGILHDRMMIRGARLLAQTVRAIGRGNYPTLQQSDLMKPGETLKTAPKIHPEDCRILWNKPVRVVYNLVRGLSPHPSAWTILVSPDGQEKILKVFSASKLERKTAYNPGTLMTDGKSILEVVCRNGLIKLKEVQLEGKTKMKIEDFLKGLKNASNYTVK